MLLVSTWLFIVQEDKTYSNGLIYKFDMLFRKNDNTEERVENKLFVRLVDSQTKEVSCCIQYINVWVVSMAAKHFGIGFVYLLILPLMS